MSLGAIVLAHVQETCSDRGVGFGTLMFFIWVVITQVITPFMIDNVGTSFTFGFYGVWTFFGSFYLHCFLQDTTYKTVEVEEDDGKGGKHMVKKRMAVSEKEKKQLYMSDEYKDK